ncbi:MAG: GNAT family N-acetyltransferase [Gaiellaceae bacterium]
MEAVRVDDAAEYLRRAEPLLLADEERHNLLLGVAGTLRDHPGHYPEQRLWLVLDDDDDDDGARVVGAAVQTPPHNLILARPAEEGALEVLAEAIDDELPGVVGAVPEVELFGEAWERVRGAHAELRFAQGIYALEELISPEPVPGRARAATEKDRPLLEDWLREFAREALGQEENDERLQRVLDSRLTRADAGFVLWDDDGPVSLAGFGGTTPNGTRIGPVYTPREHRGRGYGSAATAAVSAARLVAGRRFCFLYTDLSNPTSNKIYVALGYRRVCDSLELAFRNA